MAADLVGAEAPGQSERGRFSVQQNDTDVTIELDGELFTRYLFGGDGNKPYFWPIVGPGGAMMTRAYPMQDIKGERQDHPHHRSFYFGHESINDVDTWHERRTFVERAKGDADKLAESLKTLGSTHNTAIVKAEASADSAVLVTDSVYRDSNGEALLTDRRQFTFRVDDETGARMIDVDLTFHGSRDSVTLHDAKDSGFSVRVAHSMSVDAEQGGTIVNSDGQVDDEAWGKRTSWCDYSGPVEGKTVGIAILNHPSSFRYPTPWHVRAYGLFTANPFGLTSVAEEDQDGSVVLNKGETLSLRYRVIFHRGDAEAADIKKAFDAYAMMKLK